MLNKHVSHLTNAMKRVQKLIKKRINCNCDPGSRYQLTMEPWYRKAGRTYKHESMNHCTRDMRDHRTIMFHVYASFTLPKLWWEDYTALWFYTDARNCKNQGSLLFKILRIAKDIRVIKSNLPKVWWVSCEVFLTTENWGPLMFNFLNPIRAVMLLPYPNISLLLSLSV